MGRRSLQLLVVAALSATVAARAETPNIAIAPVTGDRVTADLRARVAKSLADGLVASGASVAPSGVAAYVLRGTLEVEGRSYALRLEMMDAKTGAVLATREDRCEICTETEALETWNTAASTLKTRVIKRPDVATTNAPPSLASPATPPVGLQLDASVPPPPRHRALGWAAVAGGAVAIGVGTFWASYDWQRACNEMDAKACADQYHNNKWYGGALGIAGVALVSIGMLALLGKL